MLLYFRFCLIFLLSSFVFVSLCIAEENRNSISGHIYDIESGKPIENVNVYISNTTWGSSTNTEGFYEISQIPEGIQELVVTVVGYAYQSKKILLKYDSRITYDFRLRPVIYETETTVVEGTIPDDWYRELKFFKKHFLGQSVYADNCIIENEIYLNFEKPNAMFFLATCDRPLIIVNKMLGYRIECILVNFSYNYNKRTWTWAIKPKFTELIPEEEEEADIWRQNRRDAYLGSLYHFLKSFRNFQLEEENFDISPVTEAGQKIPQQTWRPMIIDYDDYVTKGIIESEKKIHFVNFLHVVYNNSIVSWIGLNLPELTLDEYGYPTEDNPYEIYGSWAFRAVGDLLPKNYSAD